MQSRAPRTVAFFVALLSALLLSSCLTGGGTGPDLPKKTEEFFELCNWDFESLEPSRLEDISDPNTHHRYYLVEEDVDRVWEIYTGSDPSGQWRGPIANLAAIYDPRAARLHTMAFHEGPDYAEGQIYFLDLVIESFYHLPVAFMISDIDPDRRLFAFNYLQDNTSRGRQEITFIELPDGGPYRTLIRHMSWFKSDSDFRDRLYAPYHEEALDEFHFNIVRRNGMSARVVSRKKLEKKGLIPADEPL